MTTTLLVESGVVVQRHVVIEDAGRLRGFLETEDEVGKRADGYPAVLIDALYEQCRTEILTRDLSGS